MENTYYFHTNHLGSVDAITDDTGTTVTTYDYDSYGKATLTGYDVGNSRLFTGRQYDEETALYYNRARYYSPTLGRFISRDPIGIEDDINLYLYTANNPVNYVDRMGMEKNMIIKFAENFYIWNYSNLVLLGLNGERIANDNKFKYPVELFSNSFCSNFYNFLSSSCGSDMKYNFDSNLSNDLKNTDTFDKIMNITKSKIKEGKFQFSDSSESIDSWLDYTLHYFNYSVSVTPLEDYYNVDVIINDRYDFHQHCSDFGSCLIAPLTEGQDTGIIKNFNLEININQKIYYE